MGDAPAGGGAAALECSRGTTTATPGEKMLRVPGRPDSTAVVVQAEVDLPTPRSSRHWLATYAPGS